MAVDDTIIKFEIIAEARIALEAPEKFDWCPVPCLSRTDRFAEKLLANADRWADTSIESRDLIDLCVLRVKEGACREAFEKADAAYPVAGPLTRAIETFENNKTYREQCIKALQITDRDPILEGLQLLKGDLGKVLNPTLGSQSRLG